jgi:hypothetical protein
MAEPARIEVVFLESAGGGGGATGGGGSAARSSGGGSAPQGWTAAAAAAAQTGAAGIQAAAAVASARAVSMIAAGGGGGRIGGAGQGMIIGGDGGALVPAGRAGFADGGGLMIPQPHRIFTGGGVGQAAGAGSGLAAVAVGAVAAAGALKVWTNALEAGARITELQGQQNAAFIGNNMRQAAILQIEQRKALLDGLGIGKIPIVGPFIKGSLDKDIASIRAFDQEINAIRGRTMELGRYSGPLASELARSQVAQIGREITQGRVLGPQLAQFERSRRAFDVEEQIEATLRMRAGLPKQQSDIDRLTKQMAENNDHAAKGNKLLQELIREMRQQKKSGLEKLLEEGIDIPQGEENRGQTYDAMKKLRDQKMNSPIFGGT